MKLLEFLKKPINNYNSRSNQKKFILVSEIQLSSEVPVKKRNYSLKSSKLSYLHGLMQKKLYSSDSIKSTRSDTSQQSDSRLEDEAYTNMCFDNFAYGSFINSELNPYLKDVKDNSSGGSH